jgi:hypothetical protein
MHWTNITSETTAVLSLNTTSSIRSRKAHLVPQQEVTLKTPTFIINTGHEKKCE